MGELDEQFIFEMGYNKGFKDGIKGSIPKDQYKARLKADMVAMLTDMRDELRYCEITGLWKTNYLEGFNDGVTKCLDAIQQKINELKAD